MTESQKKQAWISSLRFLAASPKSRTELAKKLADKGYPAPVIRETLDELEKQGFLNDRSYAQQLLARRIQGQPSGQRKISFELKHHGIPESIREEILSGLTPEEERTRARDVAVQRWERLKGQPLEKRKKRVYDLLIRRGFDYQVARDILDELRGE